MSQTPRGAFRPISQTPRESVERSRSIAAAEIRIYTHRNPAIEEL